MQGKGEIEVSTRTPYPISIKMASYLSASHTEVLHEASQGESLLNEKSGKPLYKYMWGYMSALCDISKISVLVYMTLRMQAALLSFLITKKCEGKFFYELN